MAELSDTLLLVAAVIYVAAMLGYLVEFAFGTRGAVARVAMRPARELVAVGAPAGGGAFGVDIVSPVQPDRPERGGEATPGPGRTGVAGAIGVALTAVGLAVHVAVLVTRGMAAGRVPWGNMYEFVVTLTAVFALGWLVLLATRPSLRPLGVFVTGAQALLLGFAGLVLTTPAAPLMPALQSVWLKIHVSAAAAASGLLLLAFVPAALYLIRTGYDARSGPAADESAGDEAPAPTAVRFPYSLGRALPAADSLERLAFRLHAFAFPIWTLAIICGAIWAESAWGRYWGWDPKETWSFISWVAYAAYLHARATPSVKRTTATWFAVAAWLTMLINLYVINFVAVGLHSYAGLD
ncbi:MAG: c-type cytochrome biogenesis protein CcsB [Micromonosporaceae bacterium]|nr:c-type cytochrome biogenesis protein CcsB [Micromonosporaceae bacterium]